MQSSDKQETMSTIALFPLIKRPQSKIKINSRYYYTNLTSLIKVIVTGIIMTGRNCIFRLRRFRIEQFGEWLNIHKREARMHITRCALHKFEVPSRYATLLFATTLSE